MNASLFSLISVTVAFTALVLWVYWPSRRDRIESLGRIPLDNDEPLSLGGPTGKTQEQTENRQ